MPKGTKGYLTEEEKSFIINNCTSMSDEEIAKQLGRGLNTIVRARKRFGFYKNEKLHNAGKSKPVNTVYIPNSQVKDSIKSEFFKNNLANSLYYNNLKEQFTDEELDFYLAEWASLCVQFEDIIATEKRQVDEYIKQQILGNRILRNVKIVETEIDNMVSEIEHFRKTHDMQNDQDAQERDVQLNNIIQLMTRQAKAMSDDYLENVKLKNNILAELNGRRKDRIDQISKRGTTFLSLIQEFRNREIREIHGRHIELMKMAKNKKKDEWAKPILFADGTKDCILMDENAKISLADDREVFASEMLSEIFKIKGQRILVVDDDSKRHQVFSEMLQDNQVEFCSNYHKFLAVSNEKYAAIFLDYDLGLQQKGTMVSDYIVEHNLFRDCPIVIHSMNKSGAVSIYQSLIKNDQDRKIEIYSFEEVFKSFTDWIANATNSST